MTVCREPTHNYYYNFEQDQNEMYSRYCNLHFRCKILPCLFSKVVISGFPSDAIINYYKIHYHDELIEILSVVTEILLLLLPLALQPAVGFGLSNNTSLFVPIYHQLFPSSYAQHLKVSFYFFSPSFPWSSSSSRPFQ